MTQIKLNTIFAKITNNIFMANTIKEQECELFTKWIEEYENNKVSNIKDEFCSDGLLFRGDFELINGRCWIRKQGEEEELWKNSPCRLLILTKDTTQNGGQYDIRSQDTGLKTDTGEKKLPETTRFYQNLFIWSYLLLNAVSNGEIIKYLGNNINLNSQKPGEITSWDCLPDWENLWKFYSIAPIARVNCKKQIGYNTCENQVLKKHIDLYSVYLKEQIEMYDADIILCCGGSDIIKNFVKENYFEDLTSFNNTNWIYYSEKKHKIVINSYHPSYRRKKPECIYNELSKELGDFLQNHINFKGNYRYKKRAIK